MELLLTLFADDTTLWTRTEHSDEVEHNAIDIFAQWGETVNRAKTERLIASGTAGIQIARMLGAILCAVGSHDDDTGHRLVTAKKIWYKLCQQLLRLGLTMPQKKPACQNHSAGGIAFRTRVSGCHR